MKAATNPREVPGDNTQSKHAQRVSNDLARDYAELAQSVTDTLAEAHNTIPPTVENEDDLKLVTTTVVEMRRTWERAEALRVTEKEPYWEGGKAVDSFFNSLKDRLGKAMQVIGGRGDAYKQKKLAEERAERDRLARETAEREAAGRKEAKRLEDEAREARERADRARKPETIAALEKEATVKAQAASQASAVAQVAAVEATNAQAATEMKPSETRSRFDSGHMATMKQIPHVKIIDRDKIPLDKIAPYIKDDHMLAAVKAWAKVTNHKQQMPGCIVEMVDSTVYR